MNNRVLTSKPWITVLMAISFIGLSTLTGCSSMKSNQEILGYKPAQREIREAKGDANGLSSRVLDWMKLKGNFSEAGARVGICEAIDPDFEEYYLVHHSWSVYDLTAGSFEKAMSNLRKKLPEAGWELTRDGVTKSRAKNPIIIAVHPKSHHTLRVEWRKERSGNLKELILVNINSRCYEAPPGTDISRDR